MENFVFKPAARQRFDELCNRLNSEIDDIEVIRTVTRNGVQVKEAVIRRQKVVSDGAQSTGKAIIQSYAHFFRKLKLTLKEGNDAELPSLRTNTVKLSGLRQNVTSRTIRNHIKKLREIGFITAYKFHGSKHDFELWLNPQILWGEPQMPPQLIVPDDVFSEATSTETPVFQSENGTNFPHRQPNVPKVTVNSAISKAEKLSQNGDLKMATPNSQGENCQKGSSQETPGQPWEQKRGRRRLEKIVDNRWESSSTDVENRVVPGVGGEFSRLTASQQHYVAHFWNYAAKILWPQEVFHQIDTFAALDAVTMGVYKRFFDQNPGEKLLNQFHTEQMKAVDLAARYYQKHPDKYPGHPAAKFVEGRGYFDYENQNGFRVAKGWRAQQWVENREEYGKRVIHLAILHLKNHKKGKAPKHLQAKTYRELYNYYDTRMKKFSQRMQYNFYKQVSTLPL